MCCKILWNSTFFINIEGIKYQLPSSHQNPHLSLTGQQTSSVVAGQSMRVEEEGFNCHFLFLPLLSLWDLFCATVKTYWFGWEDERKPGTEISSFPISFTLILTYPCPGSDIVSWYECTGVLCETVTNHTKHSWPAPPDSCSYVGMKAETMIAMKYLQWLVESRVRCWSRWWVITPLVSCPASAGTRYHTDSTALWSGDTGVTRNNAVWLSVRSVKHRSMIMTGPCSPL